MTRPTTWYDGIPPVTAEVRCDGEQHRLAWRRGRVLSEDHDLHAEAALAALGGGTCPCVEIARAARAGLSVEDLFLLWTEHAEPSVGASQALERWARRVGAAGPPTTVTARRAEEARAAALSSLPVAFRRRLALGVFQAIARELDVDGSGSHPSFAPVFGSLIDRAARGLSPPCREAANRPAPNLTVRWSLVPQERAAFVEGGCIGSTSAWLHLGLHASWVAEVWAWDLAVVDGQLVVAVARRSLCRARVGVVDWTGDGQVRLSWRTACRGPGGRECWRLAEATS
jgi:hypothetical protein